MFQTKKGHKNYNYLISSFIPINSFFFIFFLKIVFILRERERTCVRVHMRVGGGTEGENLK